MRNDRRRPPPPVATERERRNAVDARRTRSVEEPLDVRLRRADTYPLLEVRNPLHGTAYLVMLPGFPARDGALCTCTDFARRDLGTCKHIEAAHRWFLEHPDAPPLRPARKVASAPIWREIDRRRAGVEGSLGPDSLRARRAGAVLYERAPSPD